MPRGTQVIPNPETEEILGYTGDIDGRQIPKYKDGVGDSEIIPKYAIGAISKAIASKVVSKAAGKVASAITSSSKKKKSSSNEDVYEENNYTYSENNYYTTPTTATSAGKSDYNITLSKGFKNEYDKYLDNREIVLNDIAKLQKDLTDKIEKGLDVTDLRQNILDKIDTQLAKDVEMQSLYKLDILEQLRDNQKTHLETLKREYDKAVKSGNTTLIEETYKAYDDVYKDYLSTEQKIKSAIKERYDYEFAFIDKKLNKQNKIQEDLANQIKMNQLIDPDDYAEIIKLSQKILDNEKQKRNIYKDNVNELIKQRYILEVGSYEWNIINDQIEKYNREIDNVNIKIIEHVKEIRKVEFDKVIFNLNHEVNKFNNTISNLKTQLDFISQWKPNDFSAMANLNNQIMSANLSQQSATRKNIDELLKRRNTSVGEEEWELWNSELEKAYEKEKSLILESGNLRKQQLQNQFNQQLQSIEKQIFGTSQDEATRNLDKQKKAIDTYLSGQEKDYELQLLKTQLQKDEITIFDSKIKQLEKSSEIRRSDFEILKQEVEVEKAKQRLENLRNQKNIQQLVKKDDGTFDFTYVVDENAVNQAQQDLLNAENDLYKKRRDNSVNSQQEELDRRNEYLSELRKIQEKALSGEIKNQAEFNNAVNKLNGEFSDFGIGYNQQLEMQQVFSSYISEMVNLSNQLSNSIQSSSKVFDPEIMELSRIKAKALFEEIKAQQLEEKTDIVEKRELHEKSHNARKAELDEIRKITNEIYEEEKQAILDNAKEKAETYQKELDRLSELEEQFRWMFENDPRLNDWLQQLKEEKEFQIASVEEQKKIELESLREVHQQRVASIKEMTELNKQMMDVELENLEVIKLRMVALEEQKSKHSEELQKINEKLKEEQLKNIEEVEAINEKLEQRKHELILQLEKKHDELKQVQLKQIDEVLKTATQSEEEKQKLIEKRKNIEEKIISTTLEGIQKNLEDALKAEQDKQSAIKETIRLLEQPTTRVHTTINRTVDESGINEGFEVKRFNTGGYTANSEGLAYLDKKELILNKQDTKNMLKIVEAVRNIMPNIQNAKSWLPQISSNLPNLNNIKQNKTEKTEQHFHINKLEFPNVEDSKEIKDAILNLPRLSLQYNG